MWLCKVHSLVSPTETPEEIIKGIDDQTNGRIINKKLRKCQNGLGMKKKKPQMRRRSQLNLSSIYNLVSGSIWINK